MSVCVCVCVCEWKRTPLQLLAVCDEGWVYVRKDVCECVCVCVCEW